MQIGQRTKSKVAQSFKICWCKIAAANEPLMSIGLISNLPLIDSHYYTNQVPRCGTDNLYSQPDVHLNISQHFRNSETLPFVVLRKYVISPCYNRTNKVGMQVVIYPKCSKSLNLWRCPTM